MLHETSKSLLPLLLPRPRHVIAKATDSNLLVTRTQASSRLIRESVERHAYTAAVLDVGLVTFVVQLRLHRGRHQLNEFYVRVSSLGQLDAHAQNCVVQCGFCGTVVQTARDGHESEARGGVHDARLRAFLAERL